MALHLGPRDEQLFALVPMSADTSRRCINRSAEYTCPRFATCKLVGEGVAIACCDNERCVARARELAFAAIASLSSITNRS